MSTWYKVTMSSQDAITRGKMMELQNAFGRIFIPSGRAASRGAAMFSQHRLGSDQDYFYFSPQAFVIAKDVILAYGGVPCDQPTLSDEILMCVGSSGDRELLLRHPEPESENS
jgi:hypothetical protein